MIKGIQDFMSAAGDNACYALCIVRIAEIETATHIDPTVALLNGIRDGYIRFNWDDYKDGYNFFMDYPARFLHSLTKNVWEVRHDKPNYQAKLGEYIVQRWERATTSRTFSHFRMRDWDSLADSQTVKFGTLVSTRVFHQV